MPKSAATIDERRRTEGRARDPRAPSIKRTAAHHGPPVHLRAARRFAGISAEVQARAYPITAPLAGRTGRRGRAGEAAGPPSEAEGRLRPQADGRGKARTRATSGPQSPKEPHTPPKGASQIQNARPHGPPPTRGAPRYCGASPPAALSKGRAGAPRRSTRSQHRKAARATRRHILPRRTRSAACAAGGCKREAGTRGQGGRPPPVGGEPRRSAPVAAASEQGGRPPPLAASRAAARAMERP